MVNLVKVAEHSFAGVSGSTPLNRMQSWSESLGGCKVTKPIFSAKRY